MAQTGDRVLDCCKCLRGEDAMDAKTFEAAVIKKVAWRILPLILVSYLIAYIDRANIAVAALTMNKDLGFSAFTYGLGAGIFFLGYFIFEVPSNLILERVGARWWIARIMLPGEYSPPPAPL